VTPSTTGSATETGSVTFFDQGTPLATVPLSGGRAVFASSTLSLGGHALSAAYGGDTGHTASSSSAVAVTIGTSNERFVGQLYLNLLERQPEAGGLASWSAHLAQGLSRADVALAIDQSLEARTDQVQQLYQLFLHRAADPSGLKALVTYLGAGGSLQQVKTLLTSSPEYVQVRGGGTTSGFITALYQDALNRAPDASGQAGLTQALNFGARRSQVSAAMFGSIESLRNLVAKSYEQFLKRAADDNGLNSFVKAMRAGASELNVAASMLSSNEFVAQV
jgi:hypothetical protein